MNKSVEQETTEEVPELARPLPRRIRHGRIGLGMVASLFRACVILSILFLSLSGRTVPMPEMVKARVEAAVNARLGDGQVRIGDIRLGVARDGIPRVRMNDVAIGNPAGGAVAVLNTLRATLSPGRLLRGELAASQLELTGAQITLRRTASGEFAFAGGQSRETGARSVPGLLNLVDEVFSAPALSSLETVEAGGIVLSLEDARSGRIWQATNATLILRRADRATTLTLVSDVFNGTDDVAEIQVSVARNLSTSGVSLGATVARMPAADIALQSPVLAWLGVLDAPLSGSVRTEIAADGAVSAFAGTLDIGAGALQPLPDVQPVAFSSARTYFTFDPARQRIDFSDLAVVSEYGRLAATGHTYLAELSGPWPRAFLGQFNVSALEYGGEGVFEEPLALSGLRADLRLRLDPFTVEIGQVALDKEEAQIRAKARVSAEEDGWHVSVDAQSPAITSKRVLAHWPIVVSPVTRGWLADNLRTGTLRDVSAGFRFKPGEKPDTILSFEFDGGDVSFLKQMPLLTGAAGRATLLDKRFALFLDEGWIDSGRRGVLDASGSAFVVPDVRQKPATGEIALNAAGPLDAALEILNNPPLRIMDRARRSPDLATADARAEARIVLPLARRIGRDDIDYSVTAELREVSSDRIAAGRLLSADRIALDVTTEEVRLDGPFILDGVPLQASWRQPLGEAAANGGWVEGTVVLSEETMKALDIPLPEGLIGGRGTGQFRLDLPPGAPPQLSLSSDLSGLSMSIDGLGWRKAAGERGGFDLAAQLGETPVVEGLSLSAAGLALDGRIMLGQGGGFEGAVFDSVKVGGWLDGSVEITARDGGAAPAVKVTEGRLDVRGLPEGNSGPGDGAPFDISLTELVVTDSVSLAPVRGSFQRGRAGLSGTFEARVNGATPVRGTLAPANAGTAVRIQSDDAGGAIRDAGLTPNARGGTLDLVLTPVRGAAAGTYDGQFLVEGLRLRRVPALAGLLDAVSVVGLLDQLAGPGILFSTVDGKFRLTRERLTLTEAAAVGGSLGISADGIYDFVSKRMDIRGVISPVYFVNGIGAAVSRRGEGLFGFNYRMTGPASAPEVSVNPLSILAPGALRRIFRGQRSGE